MLTNDMTDEQFLKFEEREKLRADALHHTRKEMKKLAAKYLQDQIIFEEEKQKAKN